MRPNNENSSATTESFHRLRMGFSFKGGGFLVRSLGGERAERPLGGIFLGAEGARSRVPPQARWPRVSFEPAAGLPERLVEPQALQADDAVGMRPATGKFSLAAPDPFRGKKKKKG